MIYKESLKKLHKGGLIKKCPVDSKASSNLIMRALKDLNTAKGNLENDPDCTYTYAYTAMLRSGLALMLCEGYRPDIKDKHLTVIRFASSVLDHEAKDILNDYDSMRRKRHRFVYEPDIPCSLKEAESSLKSANSFVNLVHRYIRKRYPQLDLSYKNK